MHYSKFVAKLFTIVYRFIYEKLFPAKTERIAEIREYFTKRVRAQSRRVAILRYVLAERRASTHCGKHLFHIKGLFSVVRLSFGAGRILISNAVF